jgi:hypothetical protein
MSLPSKESGFSVVGGGVRGVRLVVRWLDEGDVAVVDVPVPFDDESSSLVINQMPTAPRTRTMTAPTAASGIHGIFDPPDGGCWGGPGGGGAVDHIGPLGGPLGGAVWNAAACGPDGGGVCALGKDAGVGGGPGGGVCERCGGIGAIG